MSERTCMIQAFLESLAQLRQVTQTQADGTPEAHTYHLAHEPEPTDDPCPSCGRLGNGEPCAPYCGATEKEG